jgi:hypothetical protein
VSRGARRDDRGGEPGDDEDGVGDGLQGVGPPPGALLVPGEAEEGVQDGEGVDDEDGGEDEEEGEEGEADCSLLVTGHIQLVYNTCN